MVVRAAVSANKAGWSSAAEVPRPFSSVPGRPWWRGGAVFWAVSGVFVSPGRPWWRGGEMETMLLLQRCEDGSSASLARVPWRRFFCFREPWRLFCMRRCLRRLWVEKSSGASLRRLPGGGSRQLAGLNGSRAAAPLLLCSSRRLLPLARMVAGAGASSIWRRMRKKDLIAFSSFF